MNKKLFDFNNRIEKKLEGTKIPNNISCARYSYVKKNSSKKIKCEFITKYVSNIDVPYKRYTLQ